MNRAERRRLQRIAGRHGELPIEVFDLGDGHVELVIGGTVDCGCDRCALLRALRDIDQAT